jgi:signal transduction histidine kinase
VPIVEEKARAVAARVHRSGDLFVEAQNQPVPMAEEYLSKIVDELVQNAFKFSKPNTPVRVTLAAADQGLALAVADQGRGLSPEQIAHIGAYMQFDRELHEQQGLGLGLTICRRLAEMHGATLTMQSQPDAGTVVTLTFPKAGAGPPLSPRPAQSGSRP